MEGVEGVEGVEGMEGVEGPTVLINALIMSLVH